MPRSAPSSRTGSTKHIYCPGPDRWRSGYRCTTRVDTTAPARRRAAINSGWIRSKEPPACIQATRSTLRSTHPPFIPGRTWTSPLSITTWPRVVPLIRPGRSIARNSRKSASLFRVTAGHGGCLPRVAPGSPATAQRNIRSLSEISWVPRLVSVASETLFLSLPPCGGGSGWGSEGVSAQPLEVNTFFKRSFDAAFLQAATGDEVLVAAQRYLRPSPPRLLKVDRQLGLDRDPRRHGHEFDRTHPGQHSRRDLCASPSPLYPDAALRWPARRVVSVELADSLDGFREARDGERRLPAFTTTLNPHRVNRWTPYRFPTSDVGGAVQATLPQSASRKAG